MACGSCYKAPGFNEGKPFAAVTRSSNLCQELGQVGYIFSDKTGTLTQNDMALRRVSIGGQKFGTFQSSPQDEDYDDDVGDYGDGDEDNDEQNEDDETGSGAFAEKSDDATWDGFDGGRELQAAARGMAMKAREIDAFLEVLVSHTVMVTSREDLGQWFFRAILVGLDVLGSLMVTGNYEAESPDEFALVKEEAQNSQSVTTTALARELEPLGCIPDRKQDLQYRVLATNAFNSARKRMSVVVQKGSEHLLLVKGADNARLPAVRPLEADLTEFSEQGLRTLVLGSRSLQMTEVSSWLARYEEAQRATTDRDKKLEQVAEEIEKNLTILGATAIEDKLQDGVPETIENIRKAGIKLWVLTGDKLETARNIGFSTRVLTSQMDINILDMSDHDDIGFQLALRLPKC
ncbi:ATP8B1 [Symbiodinium necroappetens]|uniref:P-type sodium-transporting ATPase4 n=1 Tax=Symbiodinium necroappetens TaxID=1628268 RepID=A0A813BNB3_9DINO|nr:ATP8B1 [Symbiodinium necroappetens]